MATGFRSCTDKIHTLHEGDPAGVGHRGLVSAGTGLGECVLIWDGEARRHLPIPSEGGHVDLPRATSRGCAAAVSAADAERAGEL